MKDASLDTHFIYHRLRTRPIAPSLASEAVLEEHTNDCLRFRLHPDITELRALGPWIAVRELWRTRPRNSP